MLIFWSGKWNIKLEIRKGEHVRKSKKLPDQENYPNLVAAGMLETLKQGRSV